MIRPFSSQLGIVRHVLTGKVKPYTRPDTYSAIGKQVVDTAVTVSEEGLEGDEQGDLRVHGGLDKAVHFYPMEHYAYWQSVLGEGHIPAIPGAFGENLSTEGITEQTICLDDRLKIGSVVLEITQGRQPCWELNDRFGIPDMALRVQQSLYTGWYARIIQPGLVTAGDNITLLARPCPDWPIARIMEALYHSGADAPVLEEMLQLPLVASWQRLIGQRIATRQVECWKKRLEGPRNGEHRDADE